MQVFLTTSILPYLKRDEELGRFLYLSILACANVFYPTKCTLCREMCRTGVIIASIYHGLCRYV